ncbi:MAG TPA: GNAT family N-acetyltransferase [Flavitalea sp.]|nr:GNAT family N-acetyltransferase [Flavitalea sp.]
MKIGIAGLSHIEELQSVSRRTFSETFADHNSKEDLDLFLERSYSLDALRKELSNPDSTFFLLYVNSEVQGYMKLNRGQAQTEYQGEEAIEIERIYVTQAVKGNGYGKALLNKAIEISKWEELPFLWLGVWEENAPAIRFYEKNGFVAFGEHTFMLGTDPQRDILMKLVTNESSAF